MAGGAGAGVGNARLLRLQQLQHAIANISDGFFQLRTVLILGLGNAADAIEILAIGYILAVYEDKEGIVLTRAQQSLLAAAIFAGMFTGGLLFGALIPRGLSGYNTKWFIESALPVIERELSGEVRSPVLITLWLGANDAALPDGTAAGQHVPVANYTKNLVKIVQTFQASAPNAQILLITPPHVDDSVRKSRSPAGCAERTNLAAGEYARACVEAAGELKVNVVDLYSFFNGMSESERAACLDDGLHFTAKGNRLVDQQVHKKISEAFPEVVKQLEAWQLPDFHIWIDV
ncbi:putative isoamyl acetate-hydrolyzing esterase 1 [Phytophthora cinnamomi]|uniref:putative isoamyl acetate-hydrolyzing esterase 1 n=1 Tax=Phytophthora cinnamomi TaxID=4785 RepID=UPI00355A9B5A|nr:putative isoamyl acetate-hydrolyzing esterase 1 [Phytophthora cinnamomi]